MENNLGPDNLHAHDDAPGGAARILKDLAADRSVLAERMQAPRWLYPAVGLLAAMYIATPAIDADLIRRAVAGLAIGSTAVLVWSYQRATGVKLSRAGSPAQLTVAALVVAILLLLSVAFALASFGLYWWIVVPGAAGFVLTVLLGKRFHGQYRDKVRHGG